MKGTTMKSLALSMLVFALIALGLPREARADTCPDGFPNYCGNNLCCPSGYSCGGGCGANCCGIGGGTCPDGYPVDCNNGKCCPSGYSCNGSSCSPNDPGGNCPAGYPIDCNNGKCCPSGYSCNGSSCSPNDPGGNCPAGYPIDCNNGSCCPSGTSCNGSSCSPTGQYPDNGPITGGGQDICAPVTMTGCDSVQACAGQTSDQYAPQAYYNADGKIFNCDSSSCQSAAEQVLDYCESKSSACSVVSLGESRSSKGGYGLLVISAVIGLAFVGRRSRRLAAIVAVSLMAVTGTVALSACGSAGGEFEAGRDEVVFKANMAADAILVVGRATGNSIEVERAVAPADVAQVPMAANRGSKDVAQVPMAGNAGALVSR